MRVVGGVVRSCRSFRSTLSHYRRVKIHCRTPYFNLVNAFDLGQKTSHRHFKMSTHVGQEQWTANRVRETFLEYFKKNGHTFGTRDELMLFLIKLTY